MFTVGEKWRYPGSDTTWEVAEVSPLSNFSNHDDMLRRLPPGVRSDEPHFGKLVDGKGHIAVWRHRTLVELGYKVVR